MKLYKLLISVVLLSACTAAPTPSSDLPSSEPSSELPSSSSELVSSSEVPSSELPSSEEISSSELLSSSEPYSSYVEPSEEPSSDVPTSEIYSYEEYSQSGQYVQEPLQIKDRPILHAWDWSVSQIINDLDNIANANYKAIQLSPLQPSKNTNANEPWWNLYQPLGFKVSTGTENPIGNKTSLTELCRKAKEKDIAIIMDVVCNHLASEDNGGRLSDDVKRFEPEIYNNKLIHNCAKDANDNDLESVVRGKIGLVSINTANATVQAHIKQMLRDYIDCGVSGFRFDAAKHIETPDDGSFASNFWPNITNEIYTYGEQKLGEKPFIYGEILYTPGAGRSWGSYTSMMSVVDNVQGSNILGAVCNGSADGAANKNFNIGNASKAVLWAESHDTF